MGRAFKPLSYSSAAPAQPGRGRFEALWRSVGPPISANTKEEIYTMQLPVKPWLETAGKFPIEHIGGIPHFNQAVDLDGPRTGILHTTEGGWNSSLSVFKQHYSPHFMLGLDNAGKIRIAQLVQVGVIGAALVTHNWIPIVQVEMIGYSKEKPWDEDSETSAAIAALMAECKKEYGIPLSRPWADGVFGMARA